MHTTMQPLSRSNNAQPVWRCCSITCTSVHSYASHGHDQHVLVSILQCAARCVSVPLSLSDVSHHSCCLMFVQAIRSRVKTHRRSYGKQMVMWYAVAAPGVDRKVLQGHMIMAADRMGLPLWSNRDAAMARRK